MLTLAPSNLLTVQHSTLKRRERWENQWKCDNYKIIFLGARIILHLVQSGACTNIFITFVRRYKTRAPLISGMTVMTVSKLKLPERVERRGFVDEFTEGWGWVENRMHTLDTECDAPQLHNTGWIILTISKEFQKYWDRKNLKRYWHGRDTCQQRSGEQS